MANDIEGVTLFGRLIVMNMAAFKHRVVARLFLALALSVETLLAQNQVVITPSPGNPDGNSFFRPFNTAFSGRFQQVYDQSLFPSLPPGGGSIFAILLRIDPFLGESFSAVVANLQINLSTIPRDADGLSPVFDQNTGADDTLALGPGRVGIGGLGGGGSSGFDVFFSLTQPFHYDPARGNLLLDFRIHTGAGTSPGRIGTLDAFDVAGDGVSSVYAYDFSLPTMGQVSSLGLATAFSVTPVPEPSTWALLSLGVVFLVVLSKLKKHKEAKHVAA